MIVLSQFLAWEKALYWGNSLDLFRSQGVDASGERREPRVDWRICATKTHHAKGAYTPVLYPLAALFASVSDCGRNESRSRPSREFFLRLPINLVFVY